MATGQHLLTTLAQFSKRSAHFLGALMDGVQAAAPAPSLCSQGDSGGASGESAIQGRSIW